MAVINVFTRRIIGFAVERAEIRRSAACVFRTIVTGHFGRT
jgi:hypothetical protein